MTTTCENLGCSHTLESASFSVEHPGVQISGGHLSSPCSLWRLFPDVLVLLSRARSSESPCHLRMRRGRLLLNASLQRSHEDLRKHTPDASHVMSLDERTVRRCVLCYFYDSYSAPRTMNERTAVHRIITCPSTDTTTEATHGRHDTPVWRTAEEVVNSHFPLLKTSS